jgi:hypothetical protein
MRATGMHRALAFENFDLQDGDLSDRHTREHKNQRPWKERLHE